MYTENLKTTEGASARKSLSASFSEGLRHVGRLDAIITRVDGSKEFIEPSYNARVNSGASSESSSIFLTSAATPVFQYIALSATTVTPSATDVSLSGEITANGFTRVQVTPSFTQAASVGGTYTITFVKTFTATGAQVVNSLALFNAITAGTMFSEIALSSTATLAVSDTLQITYTISS